MGGGQLRRKGDRLMEVILLVQPGLRKFIGRGGHQGSLLQKLSVDVAAEQELQDVFFLLSLQWKSSPSWGCHWKSD